MKMIVKHYRNLLVSGLLVACLPLAASGQYVLNTVVNDPSMGTITIPATSPYVSPAATMPIQAAPSPGYVFDRWSDEGPGGINIPNPSATNATLIFLDGTNATYVLQANFKLPDPTLTVTSTNAQGALTGNPVPVDPQTVAYGSSVSASVTTPWVYSVAGSDDDYRDILERWERTGTLPTTNTVNASTGNFSITNDTHVQFFWKTQYLLQVDIQGDGNGVVNRMPPGQVDPGGRGWWYDHGTVVTLEAVTLGGTFGGWLGTLGGQPNPTTHTVNEPVTVEAIFSQTQVDSDGDGLPNAWETRYGLNINDDSGDHGALGDPDNDGLSNLQEYQISLLASNALYAANPIHADSDGDGMDDGYEYYHILNLNAPGQPGDSQNAQAVVSRQGVYGPDGNPDQDFHWNTETGYETTRGLTSIEEYNGSDGIVPGSWDPPVMVGTIALPVHRYEPNPADTGDQTFSDTTDSEIVGGAVQGDGFDDGFEYSWDRWQDAFAGAPTRDPLGRTIPYRFGAVALPLSAAHADFDLDGEVDVAVANSGIDNVTVLYGIGGGVFGSPNQALMVGATPSCIIAVDLNNDGSPNDLVVANSGTNTISVFMCDNAGEFDPESVIVVGDNPSFVVAGDFNGSGQLDLAVANAGSDDVTILYGGGGGAFAEAASSPVVLPVGAAPSSLDAGPIWGAVTNMVLDLVVVGAGTDRAYILQNDGAGTFSIFGNFAAGAQPSHVRIGDFGGAVTGRDGTNDVTISGFADDSVRTFFGTGNGSFLPPSAGGVFVLGAGRGPKHFGIGNFNDETDLAGHVDVAVVNQSYTPGTARILIGTVSAAFAPGDTIFPGEAPSWVQVDDFDGDGHLDLLIVERDSSTVSTWWGLGNGHFVQSGQYATSSLMVDRRFHGGLVHPEPPDFGRRDYDLRYNPDTGGPGGWLTDEMEYNAWDDGVSPLMRREFPNRRRCTNPFLWDTDGDRLPDGWEMAFGLDPWDVNTDDDLLDDDEENDDGDWYADDEAGLKHHEVYQAYNFHPGTGYGWIPEPGMEIGPNTMQFTNYEELIGPRGIPALVPNDPDDTASHPYKIDTDGDGIWDGWEWYVGLNARDPEDAGDDPDPNTGDPHFPMEGDGLSHFEEFDSFNTSTNVFSQRFAVEGWQNKLQPTDPWDQDTDWDQVYDGAERLAFNFSGGLGTGVPTVDASGEIVYIYFTGGGLNPTSADTDGDLIPDGWEANYAGAVDADTGEITGGMDGTAGDHMLDADGDGLRNYQEYMIGSVPHWQFQNNVGIPIWVPYQGIYGYEPYDFFNDQLSGGGQWWQGHGGRRPRPWDPHYMIGPIWHRIPWSFITGASHMSGLWYSSTDPQERDSDWDDMDDFWEVYHGLNPLFGGLDLVRSKVWGVDFPAPFWDEFDFTIPINADLRRYPWLAGHPIVDFDMDQLPNIFESMQEDVDLTAGPPPYYHTSPSPYWVKDTTHRESWVNQFYWLGDWFGNLMDPYWWWDMRVVALIELPPSFVYSFPLSEGFDTDYDHISDHAELVHEPGVSPGVTDPLESQAPIKRRALYLNGTAAARTMSPLGHIVDDFRQFTVECWARPENPARGLQQILIERPLLVPQSNPLTPNMLRVNFRIGLDANGRPFAGYHGAGADGIFVEAKGGSQSRLPANEWAHLAATYGGNYQTDGTWIGILRLYINGMLASATPTSEIPFNGWIGGLEPPPEVNFGSLAAAPIVVGAGDNYPPGWPHNSRVWVGPLASPFPLHFPPQLHSYYQGWVDQVHIWDGERSQGEIRQTMYARFTRDDVHNLIETPFGEPSIRYAYSFDDLPDPDYNPVAPHGFNLLIRRPEIPTAYTGIPWWSQTPYRSTAYNDYRYIPWISNLAGHAAVTPPYDSRKPLIGMGIFPNTSNPYTMVYEHAPIFALEWHPDVNPPITSMITEMAGAVGAGSVTNAAYYLDLLPLRDAEADEDVEMWDLAGGTGRDDFDTDGDGLPDWWEEYHGFDPRNPNDEHGRDADPDGDGLGNYYEFLVGTDPNAADSSGDGRRDGDADADGDGLSNAQEQILETRPDRVDTDDDGLTDWEEVTASTDAAYDAGRPETSQPPQNQSDPLRSLDPWVMRSMRFDGNSRVIIPPQNKLMAAEWTLEMWVHPDGADDGGILMSRRTRTLDDLGYGVNYELGLTTNAPAGLRRPYVRYALADGTETRLDGTGLTDHTGGLEPMLIPVDAWTHLAASYNQAANTLSIYVNGKLAAFRQDATDVPPTVYGYTYDHARDEVTLGAASSTGPIADSFEGYLDEVRFWRGSRSAEEIYAFFNAPEAVPSRFEDNVIPLRNRTIIALTGMSADLAALPEDQPVHAMVQFNDAPGAVELAAVASAGLNVVHYVTPQTRVVRGTPAQIRTLGDVVRWSGVVRASDKVSVRLGAYGQHGARPVLVRLYPDADPAQTLAAVESRGVHVYHSGLMDGQYMVVNADDDQVIALSELDAVSWLSPAREDMTTGATPMAYTDGRAVNGIQRAPFAVLGVGWDGPGLGSADLLYHFVSHTADLPIDQQEAAYVDQMNKWAAVAALTFTETALPAQDMSHDISFASIDGPGGVLGFGYYPNDINPEPIAGDIQHDADENWTLGGADMDLRFVALHELGHALGMAHSDDPDAVMFPFYPGALPVGVEPELTQDDIDGILTLYGGAASFGLAEYRFDDGGVTAEDFAAPKDWWNDWASAGILDGAMFSTNTTAPLNKDSDADGMPDWWEIGFGLNPYDATGEHGAWGDPDLDALHNLAEYKAGTHPRVADTANDGLTDFFGWFPGTFRIFGELFTDFDGMEDLWELDSGLDPRHYDAHLDADSDGWSNRGEFMAESDPMDAQDWPLPTVTFEAMYRGVQTGNLKILAYRDARMDGIPDAVFDADAQLGATVYPATLVFTNAAQGYLREGPNWFFAYMDVDGNDAWDDGEPAGLAEGQPLTVDWNQAGPITIGLTDSLRGYHRFSWTLGTVEDYVVTIRDLSMPGNNIILGPRVIESPRNWFHEGDYRYANHFGMPQPQGDYQWTVEQEVDGDLEVVDSGTFSVVYDAEPEMPVAVWPLGAVWNRARNEVKWTMGADATRFRLQVASDAAFSNVIFDRLETAPYRRQGGEYRYTLPVYGGDGAFVDGQAYHWRVRSRNPRVNLDWSTEGTGSFLLDMTDDGGSGPYSIEGELGYFGKVTSASFVVEAHASPGFGDVPLARVTVPNSSVAADWPLNRHPFVLKGLPAGAVHVQAYLDQNGNNRQDPWETAGYIQESAYVPKLLALPTSQVDQWLPLWLADTDNDKIADDWEYQYTGDLVTMGPGPVDGYTDYNNDGVNDFDSYAGSPMNVSPVDPNAAGADGIPLWVKLAFDLEPFEYYAFMVTTLGRTADGDPVVRWHAMTEGGVAGLEDGRAVIVNNGVTLQYRLQYSADLITWTDVENENMVTFDAGSGEFEYVDTGRTNRVGFYRVLMGWSQN